MGKVPSEIGDLCHVWWEPMQLCVDYPSSDRGKCPDQGERGPEGPPDRRGIPQPIPEPPM
ncbi:hypothetical protein GCM10010428_72480 [Actinosynnema pretiosum subsp. pretiosum]